MYKNETFIKWLKAKESLSGELESLCEEYHNLGKYRSGFKFLALMDRRTHDLDHAKDIDSSGEYLLMRI